MAEFQVRVLYDFQAQPEAGELSIYADEVLTVTRQDVGEGWWEGTNSRGECGLFPAEYVETMSAPPPAMPPPPLPPTFENDDPSLLNDPLPNSLPEPVMPPPPAFPAETDNFDTRPNIPPSNSADCIDDWDSDWDDDASSTATAGDHGQLSGSGNFGLSAPSQVSHSNSTGNISTADGGKGTVKKSMNRFSTFVKSGGEAFILGQSKITVKDSNKIEILDNGEEIMWSPSQDQYLCTVTSPKKESKLKGFKSYITYTITPSFNNIAVSRRYKHFDWLRERLEEKFAIMPIPQLPDKQISGRYQDDFIEHRMNQLQMWVNRTARHPVLSQCNVWKHFITCTDEKRWKQGKRIAEKDEIIGALFFLGISPPAAPISLKQIDDIDNFTKFTHSMDNSVRDLQNAVYDQTKKYSGGFKREFLKLGNAFKGLGRSFSLCPSSYSDKLTNAIAHTGDTFDSIGKLYEEQPRYELDPMADSLHEYKGILASYPDIINLHKTSLNKKKEYQKMAEDGKLESQSVQDISRRTDVISYAMLAEITHFQHERVADFRYMMQCYITEQIKFYNKIIDMLHANLEKYSDE